MRRFRRRSSVKVVEPINIFEQREERIVLDATIDPIPDQNPTEDTPMTVDAYADSGAPDEGDPGFSYDLFIEDGSGEQQVDAWNLNNDAAAAYISFDPLTGQISWTPNNLDVLGAASYTFRVHSDDGAGGTDDEIFLVTVQNSPPVITSADNATFTEAAGLQTYNVESTDEGLASTYSLLDGPDPVPAGVVIDPQGPQFLDLHTTGENSDNNNEYQVDLSVVALPSWLSITVDPKTGLMTIDPSGPGPEPKVDTVLSFPVRFFDGTVWIEENLVLTITDTPPGSTDPDYDDDFFSMNHTRFLEDEANQTFDIQYSGEDGGATVTYSFDTSDPNVSADGLTYGGWLTIDANTGILSGSPINSEVTSPIAGVPYTFDIIVWQGGLEIARQADFELHVDNVDPIFTTPPRTVTITEDTTNPGVPLTNVNTTDEGHGPETSYSIIDGPDSVPAWIEIDDETGEVSITRILDNDDPHQTWDLQVQFDDGHGGVATQPLYSDAH